MPDLLAIVSKPIFERDAKVGGKLAGPGDVWPVARYTSVNRALSGLAEGGRLFLVTVRPPQEELWLVGVLESPALDDTGWGASPNTIPVTDITSLRRTLAFESRKGLPADKGTLAMALQTPRALAATDVSQILALTGGGAPANATMPSRTSSIPPRERRVIDGKYEILRRIGEGGMGVVWEARHARTGRRVAVKEILGDIADEEKRLSDRFEREARVTGAIETQHIAAVLDTGTDAATGHPFLVMELLSGEDLQQVMLRQGTLSEDVALRVVAQACAVLARAHEAGVVHRDIKPANLFLARRDGGEIVVKILDFGIARVKASMATADLALTTTGQMIGTPLYMSPEQVLRPKAVDHRTDLWSLGVVLYEALAGVNPHEDIETAGALMVAICGTPAPDLGAVAPHVSARTAAIVKRALAIDPAMRHASAEALLTDLRNELPEGIALYASQISLRPESLRADSQPAAPLELAETALATWNAEGGGAGNTQRSAGVQRKKGT